MTIAEFNYIESCLWFAISVFLLAVAVKAGIGDKYFNTLVIASIAFLVFGVSDIIEAQTGAWWRPIELLILKSVCIAVFTACFYNYIKLKRMNT